MAKRELCRRARGNRDNGTLDMFLARPLLVLTPPLPMSGGVKESSEPIKSSEVLDISGIAVQFSLFEPIPLEDRIAEQVRFADRVRAGEQEAIDELVSRYLRLIHSVVKTFHTRFLEPEELVNVGVIGLINAVKRSDGRGLTFSYLKDKIRYAILDELVAHERIVRRPVNREGDLNRLRRAINLLSNKLKRKPTTEEIAGRLGISEEEVEYLFEIDQSQLSLDTLPSNSKGKETLLDTIEDEFAERPDGSMDTVDLWRVVKNLLVGVLTPKEAEVIASNYGLFQGREATLKEIGASFGLTCERIRQIKEKAERKLKGRRALGYRAELEHFLA